MTAPLATVLTALVATPGTGPAIAAAGQVAFVGAGPGDVEHLTLRALRALHEADVVIHDRLVSPEILALIPAKTLRIDVGKQGFGPSTPQSEINRLILSHAALGLAVLRLKAGDPGIFGRLDEEIEALEAQGIAYTLTPGLTSAAAAAAAIGQSLTKRGRNAALRILTGHDMAGFAEQDWRGIAQPGNVAAIYMGKKSARFLQGRLLMHGALPDTPVTIVENASRPDQRILASCLARLPEDVAGISGPAILLYGLAPRGAAAALPLPAPKEALA
jgi:uroporphyrin-III C-methyltransferase